MPGQVGTGHRRELRLASTSPPRSDGSSRNFFGRRDRWLTSRTTIIDPLIGLAQTCEALGGAAGCGQDGDGEDDVAPGHERDHEFVEL